MTLTAFERILYWWSYYVFDKCTCSVYNTFHKCPATCAYQTHVISKPRQQSCKYHCSY